MEGVEGSFRLLRIDSIIGQCTRAQRAGTETAFLTALTRQNSL